MKITKKELQKIIKEERVTLLKEFGPQGTDGANTLIDFAYAWTKLGGAVQEQIEKLVTTYVNSGGYSGTWENDEFYNVVHEMNPAALEVAGFGLRHSLKVLAEETKGHTDADDILEALAQAQEVLNISEDRPGSGRYSLMRALPPREKSNETDM